MPSTPKSARRELTWLEHPSEGLKIVHQVPDYRPPLPERLLIHDCPLGLDPDVALFGHPFRFRASKTPTSR